MGGDLTFPSAVKVMGMNPVTGLPDYDDNGHLVVAGTPFTGDVTFSGDIAKVGNVAVGKVGATLVLTDIYAIPDNSTVYFLDGLGNSKPVSATNALPITGPTGGLQVSIIDVLGDEVIAAHLPIVLGQPIVQTGAVNYVWDESGDQGLAVAGWELVNNGSNPLQHGWNMQVAAIPAGIYIGDGETYTTGVYFPGDSYTADFYESFVANDMVGILGVEIANQSNAPGWMPSAMGDGFGNPIDSLTMADAWSGGLSTQVGLTGFNQVLAMQTDGSGNAGPGFAVTGTIPTTPADTIADLSSQWAMFTFDNIGLWGGTAVSAAFTPWNAGLDNSTAPNVPGVGAIAMGYAPGDDFFFATTMSYVGDGVAEGSRYRQDVSSRSADVAFNSDTFVATGSLNLGDAGIVLENYTVTADWVGSLGADTFTATLKGSTTGAFAGEERTLGTMTEGTSNLLLSVVSKPYPYTKIFLSALSLDTATGLVLSGVAK